jgi:predicted ATP-dependent endonuclease of OLD family
VITELHLKNFRGFEDHFVPLKPFTVVVGRNRRGKTAYQDRSEDEDQNEDEDEDRQLAVGGGNRREVKRD